MKFVERPRKADVQPDDRCARNFMPAIRIAATVIFWLSSTSP
jgi:hypothetical protein